MRPLTDKVWSLLEEEFENNRSNPNLKFDASKKEAFQKEFENTYHQFLETYMDETVRHLDRHKVAAIIIVSLLEVAPLSYENLDEDFFFVGQEVAAFKIGLAYMLEKLNEKLLSRKINKKLKKFTFPNAQSCPTAYMEIMCRSLYYTKTKYMLNPLELANELFLLEYISLTKEGIDPDLLKDY